MRRNSKVCWFHLSESNELSHCREIHARHQDAQFLKHSGITAVNQGELLLLDVGQN